MILGIIGAMDEEVKYIIDEIKLIRQITKANMEFYHGNIWGKEVVVVRAGIGKVNAAICTQVLIDDFKVTNVINVGIAGGIGENILPGDIVIADNLVQHDMDTTVFGDPLGQIPRLDTFDFKCDEFMIQKAKEACEKINTQKHFIGRILTGDQFVGETEKAKELVKIFNGLACEMEGGSIAQTCYLNRIPFVVIRSVSDNANTGAHMDYAKFSDIAIKNSMVILKNMIMSM